MELQWPLILFTLFISWACGTFGTQCVLALRNKGQNIQMRSWVVSAILLVAGGISVFFHLQHWDRIFNGFGHMTSGITQELIAIVVLAVVGIIYLALLRRGKNQAPKWIAVVCLIVCIATVGVMAHSYDVSSIPAWDSWLWIAALLGNACILGPATVATIQAFTKSKETSVATTDDTSVNESGTGSYVVIGAIVNIVTTIAAAIWIVIAAGSLVDVGNYYDLTHPTMSIAMPDINPFTGEAAIIMWVGVIVVGLVCTLIAAIVGRSKGGWKAWAPIALICAVAGTVCFRCVFYMAGVSVFMFY